MPRSILAMRDKHLGRLVASAPDLSNAFGLKGRSREVVQSGCLAAHVHGSSIGELALGLAQTQAHNCLFDFSGSSTKKVVNARTCERICHF